MEHTGFAFVSSDRKLFLNHFSLCSLCVCVCAGKLQKPRMGSLRIFDYCHYAAAILELKQKSICQSSAWFSSFVWTHVWMDCTTRRYFPPWPWKIYAPTRCLLWLFSVYFCWNFKSARVQISHSLSALSLSLSLSLCLLPACLAGCLLPALSLLAWFIIILLLALFYELSQTRLIYVTMR